MLFNPSILLCSLELSGYIETARVGSALTIAAIAKPRDRTKEEEHDQEKRQNSSHFHDHVG